MEVKSPSPFASVSFCLSCKRLGHTRENQEPGCIKMGLPLFPQSYMCCFYRSHIQKVAALRNARACQGYHVCLSALGFGGAAWGAFSFFARGCGWPLCSSQKSVGSPLIVLICGWRASRRARLSAGSGCLPRSSAQSQEPCDWILWQALGVCSGMQCLLSLVWFPFESGVVKILARTQSNNFCSY